MEQHSRKYPITIKNIFKKKMNKELLHVLTLEDAYVSVATAMTKIFKT